MRTSRATNDHLRVISSDVFPAPVGGGSCSNGEIGVTARSTAILIKIYVDHGVGIAMAMASLQSNVTYASRITCVSISLAPDFHSPLPDIVTSKFKPRSRALQ